MPQPEAEDTFQFRVRLLCALAGVWGVATGYAIFILVSQRAQEAPEFSAAMHFLFVLMVAVAVVAITEWFRDTIRGEKPETFRSLSGILTSVLLLAVFEVCVLAYEEVSQTTFESPYALKEIAARVSGKEIPYQFFELSDVPEPRRLLEKLRVGYADLQANRPSPEASLISDLGPEIEWTLFPDSASKPSRHDLLVKMLKAADPDLSDCERFTRWAFDAFTWTPQYPCPYYFAEPGEPALYILPQLTAADQIEYDGLHEKLDVLTGLDDGEMHYFPYWPDSSAPLVTLYPHSDITRANGTGPTCLADDPDCPLSRMPDISVLANQTVRDLSARRLRALLTVELNHAILLPRLYKENDFRFVDVPDGLKQVLKQNSEDTSSYEEFQNRLKDLNTQPESEAIDDRIAEAQDELTRLESRLLPQQRLVQLNRRLLIASFRGLLMPARKQFDESSANLTVLGLLWMWAGGALGWILAGGIFEERTAGAHPARRGALRGMIAAFVAAPTLVVAYVLLLRLGIVIRDVLRFPHELHYLWDSSGYPPRDMFDSTLIPTTLRLYGYWTQKWLTLAVIVLILAILCSVWLIYGRRRGITKAARWQWFALSAIMVIALALVFDANIPFIYLLVGLVWATPAVFLGICGPYLRTSSPVPRAWGWISMLMGLALILLTILRLWWSAIPLWLCGPGVVLIAVGLVMRAGRTLEEYWPLGALALGLTVCGASALVQRATFLGVLSDVHDLNAYGGYDVKLWQKMPHFGERHPKNAHAANADLAAQPPFEPYLPNFSNESEDPVEGSTEAPAPTPLGAATPDDESAAVDLYRGPQYSPQPNSVHNLPSSATIFERLGEFEEPADPTDEEGSDWSEDWKTPTRQDDLNNDFRKRIDLLRSEALGFGATGDHRMDLWLASHERNDRKRLTATRDDVARRLELSIVGSLGFWLSVGLLAGWAMRNNEGSTDESK
jgi:hypothetical protein